MLPSVTSWRLVHTRIVGVRRAALSPGPRGPKPVVSVSSPFTPAWTTFAASATALLPNPLASSEALDTAARAVLKARREADRGHTSREVLDILMAQEATRPQSEARTKNLERLAQGALVVATGQQVGLFLGPLYALHKAATAIAWARELERRLDHPVVPLFWLQTEDADFEEVKTTWLPGPDGLLTLSLDPGMTIDGRALDANARVSLGQRLIGPSIDAALGTARAALTGPFADSTLALLERCYRPERTLGEAAGDLMAELFAEAGLLVFDPRPARGPSPAETTAFRGTLAFALDEHDRIEAALSDRAAALEHAGFDVQVKVRERTSLACHHPAGPTGDRFRLVRRGSRWALSGHPGELTSSDALASPTTLSTTALLRPLLQDRFFPTLAYVGGPGEIAYFAQLPPLYRLAAQPMPLILPRARLMLTTPASRRLIGQLGLPDDAWRQDAEHLRAALVHRRPDITRAEDTIDAWRTQTQEALATLTGAAQSLGDPTFLRQADKTRDQLEQTMARALERLKRLALDRDAETRHRLERLLALIRPLDGPQERALSLPHFAAQVGPSTLAMRILAEVTPLVERRELGDTREVAL